MTGASMAGASTAGAIAASSDVINQSAADSMVQRCLSHSMANGWPPFSIAVVDSAGALILLRRQDGASSITADAALLKAQTAARLGGPTAALVAMSQDAPTRDLMMLLRLTDDPGGMPVKPAARTIGAIGVSGGTAEQDIECAKAAISDFGADKK
jgi:uncharacterized protein GlcG (DUF336 family)